MLRVESACPEAGREPQRCDREDGEAESSAKGENGQRDQCDRGENEKDGGARSRGQKFSEGFAAGEADRGGEQRHAAEAKGFDARGLWPQSAFASIL
jgi:hypothetical protein